jgi:hypothetical protein
MALFAGSRQRVASVVSARAQSLDSPSSTSTRCACSASTISVPAITVWLATVLPVTTLTVSGRLSCIAASTAVIGAIVGEWIGSTLGIGALIIQATYAFDSALLYATVIVGSCFSMSFFLLISLIERMALRQTSQPNS